MERVDKLNSFQNDRWEGSQRHLPLTVILCNPSVLREGPPLALGKILWSVVYHRFEHRVTRLKALTATISLEYWSSIDKICQNWPIRGYTRSWYTRNDLLLSLHHRRSFASSHRAFSVFFLFRAAFLRAAPQPTERPEEANGIKNIRIRCRIRRICV